VYPISAKEALFLWDIADHWSGEITPRMKPFKVLDGLVKAWWRGELTAVNGPSRLEMLRVLYKKYRDQIAFVIPESEEPTQWEVLPDGDVRGFLRCSVPLPNFQPESWDDTNCAEAFEAVAEAWDCKNFSDVAISVHWIQLTVAEFIKWIEGTSYPTPTFWQIAAETNGVNDRTKPVTKKSALMLAQTYIESEKTAGRRPTQMGLHKYVQEQGLRGGRQFLNEEFKKISRRDGVEVKRGRFPKPKKEFAKN
jgi:hypothetical protein